MERAERQATLHLADRYLLASKITIPSKFGNQVFANSATEPGARGDYRFDLVKSTGKYKDRGSWPRLEKLNDRKYPSRIKTVYWDGKMQRL